MVLFTFPDFAVSDVFAFFAFGGWDGIIPVVAVASDVPEDFASPVTTGVLFGIDVKCA